MNLLTAILPRYISELMQAELISNMRNSLYTNSVQRLAYTKQTNSHTTGPRVSKNADRKTCVYYLVTYPQTPDKSCFFKLIVHHNNKNKSINFIFIWKQVNKK